MMERVRRIYNERYYAIFDSAFCQYVNKDFLTIHGAIGYAKANHLMWFSIWEIDGSKEMNYGDCVYSAEDRK
jgi:hypothetical protein